MTRSVPAAADRTMLTRFARDPDLRAALLHIPDKGHQRAKVEMAGDGQKHAHGAGYGIVDSATPPSAGLIIPE